MLRVSGDSANHVVDQFVFEAYEPLLKRRYMQCVLMLAQSLELVLMLCVETWLFRSVRYRRTKANNEIMGALRGRFYAATDRMTLGKLRRLAVALAIWQAPPRTLAELDAAIAQLPKHTGKKVKDSDLASIPDEALRAAAVHLDGTNFVDLRNAVAHKAYRPPQEMAELCYERVPRMNRLLMKVFGVAQGQLVMPPKAG